MVFLKFMFENIEASCSFSFFGNFKQSRTNERYPVDTGCKLNVHKTFGRRPGRLLNVLCKFNLRPVSTGYGIRGLANSWFFFLFTSRSQYVSINNFSSNLELIHCGVPQSFILELLFFSISVNDFNCAVKYYAVYHFAYDINFSNYKIRRKE